MFAVFRSALLLCKMSSSQVSAVATTSFHCNIYKGIIFLGVLILSLHLSLATSFFASIEVLQEKMAKIFTKCKQLLCILCSTELDEKCKKSAHNGK